LDLTEELPASFLLKYRLKGFLGVRARSGQRPLDLETGRQGR